jgi:hypothetical protein
VFLAAPGKRLAALPEFQRSVEVQTALFENPLHLK